MDASKWNIKSYTPEWGDNRESDEPVVIRYAPVTRGWRRRMESAGLALAEVGQGITDDDLTLEQAKAFRLARHGVEDARTEMLADLVREVVGLTMGGEPLDTAAALEAIGEIPELVDEIAAHMLSRAVVTPEEGNG